MASPKLVQDDFQGGKSHDENREKTEGERGDFVTIEAEHDSFPILGFSGN